MPVAKPEFIRGNRGREVPMTCGEAMRYNGNSREEKGREESHLIDAFGRELSPEQAIQYLGGEDASYHNSIWSPSEADRAFLEEKFGGRAEAQRAMAMLMLERTGAKDGLVAVHDHGEDGWHFHVTRKGLPAEKLYGEYGAFQHAWDREMEVLRGEAARPILDWEAHATFKERREDLEKVQLEQRLMAKERFQALRATKDQDEKERIRRSFEAKEIRLIEARRSLELAAASARYRSRGMEGSSSHQIEIERIEHRAATAVTRMESRNLGQDFKVERKLAWAQFRDKEQQFETMRRAFDAERGQISAEHTATLETLKAKAELAGKLGSDGYQKEIATADARFANRMEDLNRREAEERMKFQLRRELAFAVGPASRGFLERRGQERIEAAALARESMERRHADRLHEALGTLGSPAHERALAKAEFRREEAVERARGAYRAGFRDGAITTALKAGRVRQQAREREALEIRWAREEAREAIAAIDARHASKGSVGSKAHLKERAARESALGARIGEIRLRSQERQAAARMPVLRAMASRGTLGRVAIEAAEEKRLLGVAKTRRDQALAAVDARHQVAGTLGSREHLVDQKAVKADYADARKRISGRGSRAVKDAAASKGKKAISRSAGVLKDAGQKVIQAVRKEVRGEGRGRQERQASMSLRPAQEAGRAAAKATLAMTQEAILATAKAGKELAVHTATASAKMGAGLLAAIPTGGVSLKAAAKEAGRDLAEGATKASKEAGQGAKNVTREGLAGVAQTAIGALRGVKGLAEELVPHDGAAAVLKAAHEGAKALGQTAVRAAQLDLTGAGKAALLGALKTGKEAAGAAAKAAELPAALKLPLQLVEKLPVVGQVANLVKTVVETTATAAKSVEIDL